MPNNGVADVAQADGIEAGEALASAPQASTHTTASGDSDGLDATQLRATIVAFRDALARCREVLNRLNVYPVPDGDTGTNMTGTVEAVVAELEDSGPSMAEVCKTIAHGSLMGARGNSGIILCQVLRGLSEVARETERLGPADFAKGLRLASTQADGAVARPVEGTILTVVRASADAAEASDGSGATDESASEGAGGPLVAVLEAARRGAVEALAHTPEQLPVLARAGVVDAGGAGFCLLLDAFLHVADGRPLPEQPPIPDAALAAVSGGRSVHDTLGEVAERAHAEQRSEGDISDLRYEVMYLLEAEDDTLPAFRDAWSAIGDSIVVVGGDGVWNCHIHTDDIGAAIEAAVEAGRPREIRVTDLLDQVDEERGVREGSPDQPSPRAQQANGPNGAGGPQEDAKADDTEDALPPVSCAVVAVASGAGIRRLLRSLKVHRVVTGGQTMNPSTADILEAVEAVPADQVVLLPNNKNVVPVAEQVAALTDKVVVVVSTQGVAEGLAALLDYDPEASAEENGKAMAAAAARTTAGEVTRAVRASDSDAGAIAEGDWLGLSHEGIEVVDADLVTCVTRLLTVLLTDEHELVTIIQGEGASDAGTRRVTDWLADSATVEVEVHVGGQPHYPYLLSLE